MNQFLKNINSLQLELSSNCNLKCLGCARLDLKDYNSISPFIKKNEFIDLDILKNMIDSPHCENLEYIDFCGTIDDPLMYPYLLELVEYIINKDVKVIVQTNGSLRNVEYFKKLASIISKCDRSYVKFSVDGLEDTNHLYRRGSSWNKIIENATAYIGAGGPAEWQFLIFPWNKHQIEEAKQLATEMGFFRFITRPDRSNVTIDEDELKSENELFARRLLVSWEDKINGYNEMAQKYEISCGAQNEQRYFISYDAKVWPCCFIPNGQYTYYTKWKEYTDRFDLHYDTEWNSLYSHSFDEILNHDFYKNDLVQSFDSKHHGTGKYDRIVRCTATCSKKCKIGENT